MEYDLIDGLSSAIDNVYNCSSEDGSRKTKTRLVGEEMHITYVTILNSSRGSDLHYQMKSLKKESNEMITSRLRTIKKEFKDKSGRPLATKKLGICDDIETLTISPYSPFRELKYSCTYKYEIK